MKISGIKEFFLPYCGEWAAMEGKGGYGIAGIRRFCYKRQACTVPASASGEDAERRLPSGVSLHMPKKIYKLCVSYDEAGAELRQHLADRIKLLGMDGAPVWQASFRDMQADDLPPGDGVVQIYPVFQQSAGR